jgi:putative flavoprotein involved in K+ transport
MFAGNPHGSQGRPPLYPWTALLVQGLFPSSARRFGSSKRRIRQLGVTLRPRLTEVDGSIARFADGSTSAVDAVVWATGFRSDHTWIGVPDVFGRDGSIAHHRGVTPSPGLYVLGLSWLHTRGSALLGWVKDDADYLADVISEHARQLREPLEAA